MPDAGNDRARKGQAAHEPELPTLPSWIRPRLATIAELARFSSGLALATLLVVHVDAALRHHFIQRDCVLTRMLPPRTLRK